MLVNTHSQEKKTWMLLIGLLFFSALQAQSWTLQQCLDTALVHNKNLAIAAIDRQIAGDKQKEAISYFIPKLYANADYRYYRDLPYQLLPAAVFNGPVGVYKEAQFGTPLNLNASLSTEIPLLQPQGMSAIGMAKPYQHIQTIQYQQQEEQIILEVSQLYYNLQLLQQQKAYTQQSQLHLQKLKTLVQSLHEQQLAKGSEVDKLQLQELQARNQAEKINLQYEQTNEALKSLLGISRDLALLPAETLENSISKENIGITENAETALGMAKSTLLKQELKALKLSHLPQISLYGTYGANGYGNYDIPKSFFNTYPIGFAGIKMNWVLFTGSATEWKIAQKKKEIEQQAIRIRLLQDKQSLQLQNTIRYLHHAQQLAEQQQKQIALSEKLYAATLLQHQQGTAGLSEVLQAESARREAQQQYLLNIAEILKYQLEYKKIAGAIRPIKS